MTEEPGIAFLLANGAGPSRTAEAFTGNWMAAAVIQAIAGLRATFAIVSNFTWPLALKSTPAGFAEALSGLRIALGAVLALAALGTILTVSSRRA